MTRRKKSALNRRPHTLLILMGIALILVAVSAFKRGDNAPTSAAALEAQLDQALQDGRPTFVFLHSLNCVSCKEMMAVVAEVYPDFQDSVALIDVDVYKQENVSIVRREEAQSIPTLVFYDSNGARRVLIGAMPAGQFRAILDELTGS